MILSGVTQNLDSALALNNDAEENMKAFLVKLKNEHLETDSRREYHPWIKIQENIKMTPLPLFTAILCPVLKLLVEKIV